MVIVFFRSVSHQLYGTESHHPQIRALAIQHLINCPEHFIEYNTDQSWAQYLHNMSQLGTWADNIIIQAVANAKCLRIHVIESAQNFAEATLVSSIYTQPGGNVRDIYIGHLAELHYVSTMSIAQSGSEKTGNQKRTELPKSQSRNSLSNETLPQNCVSLQSRKDYMREYMKKRCNNNEFRKKESERKKLYNKKYKILNSERVKQMFKKATAAYRQSEKVNLRR